MSDLSLPCPLCAADTLQPLVRVEHLAFLHCADCDLRLRHPMHWPQRDAEHAHYRLHDNRPDDPSYRNFLRPLCDALTPRLPAHSRGLDFGCGPGSALAAMLREAGHEMALWDPLFEPDTRVLQDSYDFVTASEVIEHLHTPMATLRQIDDLIQPGGWFGVMTGFPPEDAEAFARWHYRRDPTHVAFYSPATMHWIAERLGWSLQQTGRNVAVFQKPPG